MYKMLILSILLQLPGTMALAQQRLDMEGTAIIGNKELPNVLYIVPWKSPESVTLEGPKFTSVLDEILQPVDRATFRQQVNYHNELYPPDARGR